MAGQSTKEFVKVYTKEAYNRLSNLEKQQHPFAFAKTITQLATGAVLQVREKTRQTFELHTEFIPKGVNRTMAKKSELKATGKTKSVIFTKPKISGFMPRHEFGETSLPVSSGVKDAGKYFAIPSKNIEHNIYTPRVHRIKKKYKPKTLLKNYKPLKNKSTKKTGVPMIVRNRKNKSVFIVRSGSKKTQRIGELEILYIFVPKAKYKPVWKFEEAVDNYVKKAFEALYKRNLRLALRNSKR